MRFAAVTDTRRNIFLNHLELKEASLYSVVGVALFRSNVSELLIG